MGVEANATSIAGKYHLKSRIPQRSFLLYMTQYNSGQTEIAPQKSLTSERKSGCELNKNQ